MVNFATLDEVKGFFNIEDDEIDSLIQNLIEHYSTTIIEDTGVSTPSHSMKEALFLAIGCHLSRIQLDKIAPTIAYTIGSAKERYQAPATSDRTWCEDYLIKIDDIKSEYRNTRMLVSGRRKGIRDLNEFRDPY
jgi:hypothetical protein